MADAVAAVLPFAVGIMVSPIPIVAVILMLFTDRAHLTGPLFLLGWVLGLTLLAVVVYVAASALGWGSGSEQDVTEVSVWRLLLGATLLVLAARKLRGRRDPERDGELPAWMSGIEAMTPTKAFTTGLVVSSLNPKNLGLGLAAMTNLVVLGLAAGTAAVGIVVFVVVASLSVAAAVVYHAVGGAAATRTLESARTWLERHNDAVMAVLLLVFGVLLVSQGLAR